MNIPNTDLPFLASRKTFDTSFQMWWEFPIPGSGGLWTLGPFASVGTSSVLDKNELKNDETTVSVTNPMTGGDAKLDTTQAKTDNDLKRYFEYGAILSVYLKNRGLFLQSTFTRGNWESFDGLYPATDATATTPATPGYNTKNRFHGFLKVFPMGLKRGFDKTPLTPVFGVDLNASRGPDSLRFFSGFVIKLSGIPTESKAAAETTSDKK